jgi:FeS assembly protein IscX
MKWIDVNDIAVTLFEKYPEVDPKTIHFVDLHNLVIGIDGFDDNHHRGGEKVLEAIQAAWIDELE